MLPILVGEKEDMAKKNVKVRRHDRHSTLVNLPGMGKVRDITKPTIKVREHIRNKLGRKKKK